MSTEIPAAQEYDSFKKWMEDNECPSGFSGTVSISVDGSPGATLKAIAAQVTPGFYMIGWLEENDVLDPFLDPDKHSDLKIGAEGVVLEVSNMSSIGSRMWFGPYARLEDIDLGELEAALEE